MEWEVRNTNTNYGGDMTDYTAEANNAQLTGKIEIRPVPYPSLQIQTLKGKTKLGVGMKTKFRASKILRADILENNKKYVKNGYLVFNRIVFQFRPAESKIKFMSSDGKFLASMKADAVVPYYIDFDFELRDGRVKINIEE